MKGRAGAEAVRRRGCPVVLLVVVLLPAGAGAAAVGVVADVLSRERTRNVHLTYEVTGTAMDVTVRTASASGAFATAVCGRF
ncbi:hypothetical protein ACFU8W_08270 [Streptomyces sp. NPDC057565]|uniref:hypothetical protein n=1 Tax=Streptomyces sp. NPDC057565 TaxID=3346169 RepID=UPI0036895D64